MVSHICTGPTDGTQGVTGGWSVFDGGWRVTDGGWRQSATRPRPPFLTEKIILSHTTPEALPNHRVGPACLFCRAVGLMSPKT